MQLLDQENLEIEQSDHSPETMQNNNDRVLRFQAFWRRFRSRTYVSCVYALDGSPCDSLEGSAQ
eukprot:661120-Pyramimonas_sp.AAC.1